MICRQTLRSLLPCCLVALAALALLRPVPAPAQTQTHPWPEGEKLVYEIYWPSGVTMGEATLEARSIKDNLYFSLAAEIVLPQGRILYRFASTTTKDLCSKEFKRSVQRSGKFWEEATQFDAEAGKATVSRDGQSRDLPAANCARDPLAYLYYHRAQTAAGKRASTDPLFLAGPLELRIEPPVKQSVKIKRSERQGNRYRVRYPSASVDSFFEMWFDGSSRQAPIAARLPLPLATFSAELR